MKIHYSSAAAAADIIVLYKPQFKPKIGIVLGTGLGGLADQVKDATIIPYYKLPGFHHCTAEGHAGNLLLGHINGTAVACYQGRPHMYEGIPIDGVKTLVRTLKLIGCEMILLTNAAGSLRKEVGPGRIMLINDHINLQTVNPLVGPNDDEFGPRFITLENAYDENLRNKIKAIASKLKIKLAEGVYVAVMGPNYETPAEICALRVLGADAVAMSTVPEVIVARHCGLKVVAMSIITNLAAGMGDEELTHEMHLRNAKLATENITNLVSTFCKEYKGE